MTKLYVYCKFQDTRFFYFWNYEELTRIDFHEKVSLHFVRNFSVVFLHVYQKKKIKKILMTLSTRNCTLFLHVPI